MARVSAHHLEQLVREAEVLSSIKADVPNAWKILEMEIGRARAAVVRSVDPDSSVHLPTENSSQLQHDHPPRQSVRKRVKLRVPAEQYPDYNFVGRLLGPRGATLKRLERETGCRIMIRGKGSIRKDKEADVRGKPGWEHVFHEPLHVVIEVVDSPDEISATRILAHAKQLVEMLLVPVPEERDSLKRAQLRDLAILNGTHRSVSDLLGASPHNFAISSVHRSNPLASSPVPLRRAQSQHNKPSPKMHQSDYANMFEPLLPFARQNSCYSQTATQRPLHNLNPYSQSNAFASTSHDSLLPELEKLHIPALDFDHLNESNFSTNNFPIPAPSPTIVDPEIYPYPPTPGLLTSDQKLSAFASPTWTPSRPSASTMSSNSLPPRSPPANSDSANQTGSSFLLGRALGDYSRHNQSQVTALDTSPVDSLSFDQFGELDNRDTVTSQKHPFANMRNANGDAIVLANLFPSSNHSTSNKNLFEKRRNAHLDSTESHNHKQHQHTHQQLSGQQQKQQSHQSTVQKQEVKSSQLTKTSDKLKSQPDS